MSQAQLAEILGVGISTVGMWESTDRIPSGKTMQKIVGFFNKPLDYFFDSETPISVSPVTQELAEDEREVLSLYQKLTPARKEDLKIFLRALSGADAPSVSKKKA